jgi:hypothetical protein
VGKTLLDGLPGGRIMALLRNVGFLPSVRDPAGVLIAGGAPSKDPFESLTENAATAFRTCLRMSVSSINTEGPSRCCHTAPSWSNDSLCIWPDFCSGPCT